MKKLYVAGNWKMNKTVAETVIFINRLKKDLEDSSLGHVVPLVTPPALYLDRCSNILDDSFIKLGAQDISKHDFGAYTGEISAPMLAGMKIPFCLAGHSERRQFHNETDEDVNIKAKIMIANDIMPIICIGELEEERDKGITNDIILKQLDACLAGIDGSSTFLIAYEPVWAIGTGKTATPEIAQEVHQLIREWLRNKYGTQKAEQISILYGGSVKVNNFASLLAQKDIDGGLIGGASLDVESFIQLINIAVESSK